MKITHDYAARIDYDLWMDCLRVKELDAATTSINSMVNEGLKMVRDRKMQEITAQRKQRNTLQFMMNCQIYPKTGCIFMRARTKDCYVCKDAKEVLYRCRYQELKGLGVLVWEVSDGREITI